MADSTSEKWVYGSLKLANVRTTGYRQDAVTTTDGVDVIAVKHTISVAGTLSPGAVPATAGEVGADILARLRYYFRHRRYFLYAVGGKKVVEVGNSAAPNNPDLNLDAANGPKIVSITVSTVTDYSIFVEVTVETTTNPCSDADRAIVSHRFAETHSSDESGYLTINTTGTIYLRSDKTLAFADILRDAGIPRVRNGFQRIDQRAGITPNGLTVEYAITDREYLVGPPGEASQCKVKTSIAQQNSAKVFAHTSVFLKGKRDSDISLDSFFRRLCERAALIADIQLRPYRMVVDGRVDIPSVSFEKDVIEGTVNLSVQAIADPKKIQANGRMDFATIGQSGVLAQTGLAQLGSRPVGPDWSDSETRIEDAFKAAFQEPCNNLYILPTKPGKFTGILQSDIRETGNQFSGGILTSTSNPNTGGNVLTGTGGNTGSTGNTGGNSPNPLSGINLPDDIYQFPPVIDPNGPVILSTSTGTGGAIVVPGFVPPATTPTNPPANVGNSVANTGGGVTSQTYTTRTTEQRVPYEVCVFVCTTTINEGVTVIPATAKPTIDAVGRVTYPPSIKVRQHQPQGHLTVKWTLKRAGVRPLAPDPFPPDAAGLVLISRDIDEVDVDQRPSGQFLFTLTGVYRYCYLDASKAREINALGPLIINDYLLSRHAREATPSQPVSLWHSWLQLAGLADNAAANLLRPSQPAIVPPAVG